MSKKLNFDGAKLMIGGGLIRDGLIVRRAMYVTLADGTKFERYLHGRRFDPELEMWSRFCVPNQHVYQSPHWRPASVPHRRQLAEWVRAHPDYLPDEVPGTTEIEN